MPWLEPFYASNSNMRLSGTEGVTGERPASVHIAAMGLPGGRKEGGSNGNSAAGAIHIAAVDTAAANIAGVSTAAVAAAVADAGCITTLMQQQCGQHPPESKSPGTTAYWAQWRARCCKMYVAEPFEDEEEYELYEEEVDVLEEHQEEELQEELRNNPPSPISKTRTDINRDGTVDKATKPDLQLGTCTDNTHVPVPRFKTTHGGPMDAQLQTAMTIEQVEVPAKLSADLIRRVKSYVMSKMHTFDPVMGTIGPDPVRAAYVDLKWVNTTSGFVHPAGTVGPAELALLKVRRVHGFVGNNSDGTRGTCASKQGQAYVV
jgi:hypothetical protein